MKSFVPMRLALCLAAGALFLASAGVAEADVQTSLNFLSPSTIQVGGTAGVDFGVTFTPIPGTVGAPEFIDNSTSNPVTSCTLDQNACTELQFETTASILTSVFAEVIAGNTAGAPNFYGYTTTGTFPLVLSYPNLGIWEITAAGGDQEQISVLECETPWNQGVAGSQSCSTIQTFSVTGNFDAGGTPDLFVTVNPATAAPEPSSLALLAGGLIALGIWQWRGRCLQGTADHGTSIQRLMNRRYRKLFLY